MSPATRRPCFRFGAPPHLTSAWHPPTSTCDGSVRIDQRHRRGSLAAGHRGALARDGHAVGLPGPVLESAAGSSVRGGLRGALGQGLGRQQVGGYRCRPMVPAHEHVASVSDAVDQPLLLPRPVRQGHGRGLQARKREHGAVASGSLLELRGAGSSDRGGGSTRAAGYPDFVAGGSRGVQEGVHAWSAGLRREQATPSQVLGEQRLAGCCRGGARRPGGLDVYERLQRVLHAEQPRSDGSTCMSRRHGGDQHKDVGKQWALKNAAAKGHLEVVKLLVNEDMVYLDGQAFCDAATHGHLTVVQWLKENNLGWNMAYKAIDLASSQGHLEVVQFLQSICSATCTHQTMRGAAISGHLHVVQWLHAQFADNPNVDLYEAGTKQQFNTTVMDVAAMNGHLDVIKYLHEVALAMETVTATVMSQLEGLADSAILEKTVPTCTPAAIQFAAAGDHLDVLQWLHANYWTEPSVDVMDVAASSGNLAMVKWLHEHTAARFSSAAMDGAAKEGHLAVVQWLHENRSEGCTVKAIDDAAAAGYLDVVQWLTKYRTEGCSAKALEGAASGDHFDVVLFLASKFPELGSITEHDFIDNHYIGSWMEEEVSAHYSSPSRAHHDDQQPSTMSSSTADYKLFTPLELAKGLELKNRVVYSPTNRARADSVSHVPLERNSIYYEQRASAGLIVTESCAISEQGFGWYGAPALYTDEQQEGWRKVVGRVHTDDGEIFLQLWHMGRSRTRRFTPATKSYQPRPRNGRLVERVIPAANTLFSRRPVRFTQKRSRGSSTRIVDVPSGSRLSALIAWKCTVPMVICWTSSCGQISATTSTANRYRFLGEVVEALKTVYPANRIAVSGATDLVGFARLFISILDLAERFQNDWPLNPLPNHAVFWDASNGDEGYNTFHVYKLDNQQNPAIVA
ncbi:hypothetical protein ON010_g4097 [Phytophthora cinnamomi]|nr:hypothetical protein ON010_g4097 [Phytophthora cinnamomi]